MQTGGAARPAASDKRLFVAILGGTGFGWASGTGEATRNKVESPGVDWTVMGQVVPEIGYLVTPRFMIGVQGRLQLVRGATPYQVPIRWGTSAETTTLRALRPPSRAC